MDPFEISKATERQKRQQSGSAIAGAGATTAGVGLLAGGVPGAKSDINPLMAGKVNSSGKGVRRVAGNARGNAQKGKAATGGILGFRTKFHEGGLYGFSEKKITDSHIKGKNKTQTFAAARNAGKIKPEKDIIRGMNAGRKVAHGGLAVGLGAAAYGTHRAKSSVKKSEKSDRRNAALAGGGAAGAGIAQAGGSYLKAKKTKFGDRAGAQIDLAGKIAPKTAGRSPGSYRPTVSDGQIMRDPKMLKGVSRKGVKQVGKLRGASAQNAHFADVFGTTSKVTRSMRTPSAVVAGIGTAGLVSSNRKKKTVAKAFGGGATKKIVGAARNQRAKGNPLTRVVNAAGGPETTTYGDAGQTVSRAGGKLLRPRAKTTVYEGGRKTTAVRGGGLTREGKLTVGAFGVGGAGVAAHQRKKVVAKAGMSAKLLPLKKPNEYKGAAKKIMTSVDNQKTVKKSDPFGIEKALPGAIAGAGKMLKPKVAQAGAGMRQFKGGLAGGLGGSKIGSAATKPAMAGNKVGLGALKPRNQIAGGLATGAAGAGTTAALNRKQSVKKSQPISAFGVDHG